MKKTLFLIVIGILLINLASAIIICVDKTSPSAPSNLTVSGEVGNIVLTWGEATDEPSCSGIDYYNVSRNEDWIGTVGGDVLNFTDSEKLDKGNYTYTVFAVDKVGHNRGDSIVNEVIIIVIPESGEASVSGGGGGSSYVAPVDFEIYPVADWELEEGFEEELEKDDGMEFEISDEPHSLTVLNVDYDKVEIVLESTPQFAIFGPNESKSFDLNNNSMNDLLVSVGNIFDGFAEIKIQSLYENLENEIILNNVINPDVNDDENFFSVMTGAVTGAIGTTGGIIIGVFIALAVGGVVALKVRKR